MKVSKATLTSLLFDLVFILMYLDNLSVDPATSDAKIIQTAVEWNNTFCETKRFNQTVKVEGCETINIMNNYCYGQCRSLFMPYKTQGFFSCYLCTPIKKRIQNITLQCRENDEIKQKQLKMTMVEKCGCTRTRYQHKLPPKYTHTVD